MPPARAAPVAAVFQNSCRPTVMLLLELVLMLLLCAVALGWVARRLRFPYPIALVIGGAVLGFVPNLPQFPFDPQLILVLVLPPILYQAALLTSWKDFKANIRDIGLLAIGLVIFTTVAVGVAVKLVVPEIPWAAAFALGAIVSPPDAVAATTILSRLNIPRRIVTVLEGESLVNDASGLVLYKFAVAAVASGAFSLVDASLQFATLSVGGLAVGIVLAFFFIAVHKRLGDPFIEVLTSLSIPYATYIVAESLHVSGVLAVVAAGVVRGRYSPEIVSAEMRILARSVWNILVFMLNSLIFMLIGIHLSHVVANLASYSLGALFAWGGFVSAVAIAVRFVWVYPAAYLPRLLSRRLREREPRPQKRELFVISWCGMRGIVSLAAALALPVQLPNGDPFPYRDLIVFLTFCVIATTLIGQGLTLSPAIRRFKVGSDWEGEKEHQRACAAMHAAAQAAIEAVLAEDALPAGCREALHAEHAAARRPVGDSAAASEGVLRARQAAIAAERRALIGLWRNHEIGDEVLRHLEELLDYREAQLKG
jgi:monovalent cation/hydrogen antiporter